MIPYIHFPSYKLGPFTLEIFGVFVAIGIYVAARINWRQAEREGLNPSVMADFAFWGVIGGVVAAHFVHLFLYHPEELADRGPAQIVKVWDGLSSSGGVLGGLVVAWVFFWKKKIPFDSYADALAVGMAPGWAIARIGCFLVHDHPGVRTDFPLAVNFPVPFWGGPRHDLGLYDSLWLFVIAGVLYWMRRNGVLSHRLMAVMAQMYGPARFLFDTLRASELPYGDKRFFGLTPAQYGCMLIVAYAVTKLARTRLPLKGPSPLKVPAASKGKA
jgi:phosphatidylglycerol:prolipoprotein diacylglycerol transferase